MTGKRDKKKAESEAPASFEKGLERLEAIVEEMGSGRMALDDALKLYEEGSKLAGFCRHRLEEAEKKIEILSRRADGSVERQPFADAPAAGEEDAPAQRKKSPSASATRAGNDEPADEESDDDDPGDEIDLPF